MKIVMIGHYQIPYPFTAYRLDYPMLKAWAGRVDELHVIVQSQSGPSREWREANLVVHYAPRRGLAGSLPGFLLWAAREVIRIHRQIGVDIVNGSDLWGALIGVVLRGATGAKVITQLQGEFLPPSPVSFSPVPRVLIHLLARLVCRKADRVRCLYQDSAKQVVALGVPSSRIDIFPSRCDLSLFDPEQLPPRPEHGQRLLYVGSLIPRKGVGQLLEALPPVFRQFPASSLTVVGDGPLAGKLKSMAESLGLQSYVAFLGKKPFAELPAIMHAHDVFVFPSLSDATPRSIMEAMAMELPVVSTRVGGIPELVEGGVTGVLTPPAAPPALAEAILWVLGHPGWAEKAGHLGRRRVLEHFTLEKFLDRMIAMHARALAG